MINAILKIISGDFQERASLDVNRDSFIRYKTQTVNTHYIKGFGLLKELGLFTAELIENLADKAIDNPRWKTLNEHLKTYFADTEALLKVIKSQFSRKLQSRNGCVASASLADQWAELLVTNLREPLHSEPDLPFSAILWRLEALYCSFECIFVREGNRDPVRIGDPIAFNVILGLSYDYPIHRCYVNKELDNRAFRLGKPIEKMRTVAVGYDITEINANKPWTYKTKWLDQQLKEALLSAIRSGESWKNGRRWKVSYKHITGNMLSPDSRLELEISLPYEIDLALEAANSNTFNFVTTIKLLGKPSRKASGQRPIASPNSVLPVPIKALERHILNDIKYGLRSFLQTFPVQDPSVAVIYELMPSYIRSLGGGRSSSWLYPFFALRLKEYCQRMIPGIDSSHPFLNPTPNKPETWIASLTDELWASANLGAEEVYWMILAGFRDMVAMDNQVSLASTEKFISDLALLLNVSPRLDTIQSMLKLLTTRFQPYVLKRTIVPSSSPMYGISEDIVGKPLIFGLLLPDSSHERFFCNPDLCAVTIDALRAFQSSLELNSVFLYNLCVGQIRKPIRELHAWMNLANPGGSGLVSEILSLESFRLSLSESLSIVECPDFRVEVECNMSAPYIEHVFFSSFQDIIKPKPFMRWLLNPLDSYC